ncbi:MAG TPA: YbaB/EbfC family nucleoid-associated protein [Kofleriaceae bacterium]|nr:YbaB/EbfC family nucleoid-associated protein [Kofleriaceae bacterium]
MSDGKMPDLSAIMNMAQKLQGDVTRVQEELGNQTCEASAGGGMVVAVVNGKYELVELRVEKDVVDPNDVAMLQDLIVAAVNQAMVKVREMTQAEMAKLTGGMNIPGMPKMF